MFFSQSSSRRNASLQLQIQDYQHQVQFDSFWLDTTKAGETNTDSDLTSLMRYYYSIIRPMQMGDYFFQQKSATLLATLALQSPPILHRR